MTHELNQWILDWKGCEINVKQNEIKDCSQSFGYKVFWAKQMPEFHRNTTDGENVASLGNASWLR